MACPIRNSKFHFPGNRSGIKPFSSQRVKEDQPGQVFDPLTLCVETVIYISPSMKLAFVIFQFQVYIQQFSDACIPYEFFKG
jgi:hypothetical protein